LLYVAILASLLVHGTSHIATNGTHGLTSYAGSLLTARNFFGCWAAVTKVFTLSLTFFGNAIC
jgi:hypothetical protein